MRGVNDLMNQTVPILNPWMLAAAVASALAGLLHVGCVVFGVGCVVFGASWYRFVGAGQPMVQMVEAGRLFPHLVTLAIVLVLFGWGMYALVGAGWPLSLPWARWVILAIASVYLLRGIVGFFIEPSSGRSQIFWWWSSVICVAIGGIHVIGLRQVWHRL